MTLYKYILLDEKDNPVYKTYSLHDLSLKVLEIIDEIEVINLLYDRSKKFKYHVDVERVEIRYYDKRIK